METAKLFWSGRSQAVRLPRAYRVDGREVRIRRRGRAIVLEPVPDSWEWLDVLVGELDEEMVHETRVGDVIVLGATSWRVDDVTRDRVLVKQPADRYRSAAGDGCGPMPERANAGGTTIRSGVHLEPGVTVMPPADVRSS